MTLQEKLQALASKTSAITNNAVTVAPNRNRRRSVGLSEEDCNSFDKYFNVPQGWGWAKLQKIRQQTPEDFDYERYTDSVL